MLRSKSAVAILAALGLTACTQTTTTPATPTTPTVTTTTITMTPAQLAAEANIVLAAFTAAANTYITGNPKTVSPTIQADIATAEKTAGAVIASLATANTSTAAADALDVANGLAAAASEIPGLPPQATAGIIAFQVLVAALEPVLTPPVSPTPAPASAMAPGKIQIGQGTKVILVPNK